MRTKTIIKCCTYKDKLKEKNAFSDAANTSASLVVNESY